MRTILLATLLSVSMVSQSQTTPDAQAIKSYVDSINVTLATWIRGAPELSVDTSGNTMILYRDGSRFIFNMYDLSSGDFPRGEHFHGIELQVYDPKTRPAEQHFLYFNSNHSTRAFIRFDTIPMTDLENIYDLFVSLRKLFL